MGYLESFLIPPNSVYLMHCLNKLLNVDSCSLNPLRVSWIDICDNLANHPSPTVALYWKDFGWSFYFLRNNSLVKNATIFYCNRFLHRHLQVLVSQIKFTLDQTHRKSSIGGPRFAVCLHA